MRPRVWFGERWITSVLDLFQENIRYFPTLLPEGNTIMPPTDSIASGKSSVWVAPARSAWRSASLPGTAEACGVNESSPGSRATARVFWRCGLTRALRWQIGALPEHARRTDTTGSHDAEFRVRSAVRQRWVRPSNPSARRSKPDTERPWGQPNSTPRARKAAGIGHPCLPVDATSADAGIRGRPAGQHRPQGQDGRRVLGELPLSVRLVALDFEHDDLLTALAEHGYQSAAARLRA